MKILFIQTGGTIDKDYPKTKGGWAFEFGEPATERILSKLNPSFEFEIHTASQKDSLEITEEDRQRLANLISDEQADAYIITHGTDTMIDTADYLSTAIEQKLVILTGAMRPERFSNSDAPVNLGVAIGAVSLLKPGIYVSMHGIIKPSSEIQRDPDTGKFY